MYIIHVCTANIVLFRARALYLVSELNFSQAATDGDVVHSVTIEVSRFISAPSSVDFSSTRQDVTLCTMS